MLLIEEKIMKFKMILVAIFTMSMTACLEKKGESLLASTPVVVLSSILGRTPTIDEYKAAVVGINLTDFAPPTEELSVEMQTLRIVS